MEQLVGAQRLVGVVDERDVRRFVERALQHAALAHHLFDAFVAELGVGDRALLFVELVMLFGRSSGMIASICL